MSTSSTSEAASASARAAALLAGLWGGALLAIAGIAAPAGFATAPPAVAGRIAGRMLAVEAQLGLALAVVLILLLRRLSRQRAERQGSSIFSPELMLVLGAVFCTVAGHFALLPMFAAAHAGEPGLSFAALHAVSVAFYAGKTLLVLGLAWRLGAR